MTFVGIFGVCTISMLISLSWANVSTKETFSFDDTPKVLQLAVQTVSSLLNEKRSNAIWSILLNQKKMNTERLWSESEFLPEFLKSVGVDSEKLSDFTFGGLISVLQLVSQILTKNSTGRGRKRREQKRFSFFRFIVEQPQVAAIMDKMQEPGLVDLFLEEIESDPEENLIEGDQCVAALLCKAEPFVKGMQRSLRFFLKRGEGTKENCKRAARSEEQYCKEDTQWENLTIEERLYYFVPKLDEVVDRGEDCDKRYPKCSY